MNNFHITEHKVGDTILNGKYLITSAEYGMTVAYRVLKNGRLGKQRMIKFDGGNWQDAK